MTYDLTWQDLQILLFLCWTTEEKQRRIGEAGVMLTALLPTVRAATSTQQEGMRSQTRSPRVMTRVGLGVQNAETP